MAVATYAFAPVAQAETYQYDTVGRLTKVVYDDNTSITYTYDASGNILTSTAGTEGTEGTGEGMGEGAAEGTGDGGTKPMGCGASSDVNGAGFAGDGWVLVLVLVSILAASTKTRRHSVDDPKG